MDRKNKEANNKALRLVAHVLQFEHLPEIGHSWFEFTINSYQFSFFVSNDYKWRQLAEDDSEEAWFYGIEVFNDTAEQGLFKKELWSREDGLWPEIGAEILRLIDEEAKHD